MNMWQPTNADYLAAIEAQNPWHTINRVPAELSPPCHRPLADILWQLLLHPPLRRHQIILGPRRVGKTTVMYQTVRQLIDAGVPSNMLWWLRLDHPLLLRLSLGDLVGELTSVTNASAANPMYLFLDEITYSEDWELWLKTFYDEQWPVRVVGTSSATAAIRARGTESGVGRWDEQFLSPYSFTEYLDLKSVDGVKLGVDRCLGTTIDNAISDGLRLPPLHEQRKHFALTGGFPELLIQASSGDEASDIFRSQRTLRSDAIEKAIYKDIPQAFSIQDPAKLERLLYTLAGQITGVFSPATVGADIQLAAKTLERYESFLERAFLIFTLPNYSPSEETVQRRGRKLYFVDGAVRNAALLRGLAPLQDVSEMGLLIENLASTSLYSLASQTSVRLYHWRHKGSEVDLVYDHPEKPLAFEITVSAKHSTKGLREFQNKFPKFRGGCYLVHQNSKFSSPTLDDPGTIPLDLFLVLVGRQTQFALEERVGVRRSSDGQLTLFDR